jgi:tetratricopeptide (TPR) repeat protein
MQGQRALRQGRYADAADHFDQALAENPSRTDALVGLGIARYKLGALDEAVDTLGRAVAQSPDDAPARLYLALGYLQKRDAFLAEEQLTTLRSLRFDPRLAAQIDRALEVIRSEPLTDPIRTFVAASLETEADLIQELGEARLEARRYAYPPHYPCTVLRRHGRLLFCF